MEKENWKVKSKTERKKEINSNGNELYFFLLLLFWSFPKYRSINKHEKQLVIHKAFGNSVVRKANWSGSTNTGDGNKFSGLDQFEWMEITEVPEAAAGRAAQLAADCHLHAESNRNITNFQLRVNHFNHL